MKSYYSEHLKKPKRSLVGQVQWANKHVRDYAKTNGYPKEVCVPSDKCFKKHPYCIAKFEKNIINTNLKGNKTMKSINNKKHLIQHLRSQHTPSGNPQRLWVIYDATTGYTKKVFDDGYRGQPENTDRMLLLPTFDIPKSEYHHLVKKYKACNLFEGA